MTMGKSRNKKRKLGERYGVEEGRYYRAGTNYTNAPTPKDYEDRLIKAANSDPNTHDQAKFVARALEDDELRDSLGKKAQNFLNDYKDKNKKGFNGIDSIKDLNLVNDFGKVYHKHEMGNGGKYSSANDFFGASLAMEDKARKHYDRNFLTQDDLPEQPKPALEGSNAEDEEITLSPQHQQAKDRLDDYKNSIINGSLTDSIYGKESNATKPQNLADTSKNEVSVKNDTSDISVDAFASKAKQASDGFLNNYKKQVASNLVPEIY